MQSVMASAIHVAGAVSFSGVGENPWTAVAGVVLVLVGFWLIRPRKGARMFLGAVVATLGVAGVVAYIAESRPQWSPFFLPALLVLFVVAMLRPFRWPWVRCPPDKLLVVYGKVGSDDVCAVVGRENAFVWPVIQDYSFLDLNPYDIDGQPVAIDPDNAAQAALKLLGLSRADIEAQARAILADGGDLGEIGMKVVA